MGYLENKLKNNFLFGCVKYKNDYQLYLMPLAYWILNCPKYDPTYDPNEWDFVFRDNVLILTDDNYEKFIQAISIDKIDLVIDDDELVSIPIERRKLHFFIDLDNKIFVNKFPDIALEEYLPDLTWQGLFNNPKIYLPSKISKLFY